MVFGGFNELSIDHGPDDFDGPFEFIPFDAVGLKVEKRYSSENRHGQGGGEEGDLPGGTRKRTEEILRRPASIVESPTQNYEGPKQKGRSRLEGIRLEHRKLP